MIGKRIRINDYKFTYGQEIVYAAVFGAFRDVKSGNKYIVYSQDNKNVHYGSFFLRDNMGTVMLSNNDNMELINVFISDILYGNKSDRYEILNLDGVDSIQIIDEKVYNNTIDINLLESLTIPKNVENVENAQNVSKRKTPWFIFIIMVLLITGGIFLFINPEIISGKNTLYLCTKNYDHNKLPALVKENKNIVFNGKEEVISINFNIDYVFNDINYYKDFKNKGYFYKYMNESDTYKFDDTSYTYRVFSNIDIDTDYFLPDNREELISYYENEGYVCNIKEE